MNLKKYIPKDGKMKLHELKIESSYAWEKIKGRKLFEIRLNDRDYKVGDIVHYTCTNCIANDLIADKYYKIIYITDYMQKDNYIVFAEKEMKEIK